MTGSKFDTIDTVNVSDNGDAGAQGFGDNAGGNFTSGASSTEITGVDISGSGVISFSQRITTANTVPSEYTDSAKERWLRMPSSTESIGNESGCFVVLIRDGIPKSDSEANGKGNYTETDDDVDVWTDKNKNVKPDWINPSGKLTAETFSAGDSHRWVNPKLNEELANLGDIPYGIKYGVVLAKNDTWVRIKYIGAKYPEILVIPNATANKGITDPVGKVHATRKLRQHWRRWEQRKSGFISLYNNAIYYQDYIDIELIFPSVYGNNSIKWIYKAPTGDSGRHGSHPPWGIRHDYSSYAYNEFTSTATTGKYGWTHWNPHTFYFDLKESWISNVTAHTYPSGGVAGTWSKDYRGFNNKTKATSQLGANNITTPAVPGKMNRLCSYVRGGAVTQKGAFSVSELWTKARITKENTIEFAEAKHVNFRVGDYIKIGQNGTNKSLHLNLRGSAPSSNRNNYNKEQTFITAKITGINEGKSLELAPPELEQNKQGDGNTYLDEDCYPLISGFIDYNATTKITNDYTPFTTGHWGRTLAGPVCSVIQSDLSSHVLIGHGAAPSHLSSLSPGDGVGRESYDGDTRIGDIIEVRNSTADRIEEGSVTNYTHRIPWMNYYSFATPKPGSSAVKAVDAVVGGAPRILYTQGAKNRRLYSQKGSGGDIPASSVLLSLNGGYYVDKDYLTHFDDKGITIFTPDLSSKPYVKANPTLSDGLGLTGNVTDARTFVAPSTNAVYVCVKIGDYWKLVKTSSTGPESSLLVYDFKKPIGFDGTKIWGIDSDSTSGWDIQYATPFYESNIIGSWVFFANNYETLTPTISAWGQVVNSRIGEKDDVGTPRYFSIDWKMDSGNWFETGTPTIGLNHEAGKMIAENTFKWYPVQNSFDLTTLGTGTVIADLSYLDTPIVNPHSPLASVEVSFKSKVYRDIVFFKASETLMPTAGDTGGENKISFLGYHDSAQSFYVLSDNAFKVVAQFGKEPENAYQLGQATTGGTAFDASKVGISTFLIGAPNMYNGYGPNIDFYYRASFLNKWGHESAPSPL